MLVEKTAAFVKDVKENGQSNSFSNTCYGMSKAAVISLIKVLKKNEMKRLEAGESPIIAYTSFCPGYCNTSMTSHRGPRPPAEGADTGFWLATRQDLDIKNTGGFYYNREEIDWVKSHSF
jgi:NAD(P)-dependent dehydrogenase (short-subunit alcohol dehydrogenase family)